MKISTKYHANRTDHEIHMILNCLLQIFYDFETVHLILQLNYPTSEVLFRNKYLPRA